mmetsp:Transcript_63083/g.124739  ORF Transcript_63083/g.124739 Transcript_63083/m.124739 type:complete len:252 (-) Transcript_63083:1264-2019(-)
MRESATGRHSDRVSARTTAAVQAAGPRTPAAPRILQAWACTLVALVNHWEVVVAPYQAQAWEVRLAREGKAGKLVLCLSQVSPEEARVQWVLVVSEDRFLELSLADLLLQEVQLGCLPGPLLEVIRRGQVLLWAWVHDRQQILVAALLPVGCRTACWAGRNHGGRPSDVQDGQLNVGIRKKGAVPLFYHQGHQRGGPQWKERVHWTACAPSHGLEDRRCRLKTRSDQQEECRCQSNGRTACHREALCKSKL